MKLLLRLVPVGFACVLALTLLAAPGCETQPKVAEVPVGFIVTPSRDIVLAGENVTFTATTTNTIDRDATIEWTTTGGKLEKVDNDRVTRVTFDEPGEYKVSADLLLEGKRVDTEIVKITVTPVP